MADYYGDFPEDATVRIEFNTFSSDDPSASVTITNLADADIMVHKDGSLTQIATDGATVVINFDGVTGNHQITIDTSVDAAYSTGSDYAVRIEGTTVDGGTINAWVGSFSIERAGGVLALIKAGNLSANVVQISGDATAADNMELDYDGTGFDKANSTIGTTTANTDMRGTDSAATATNLAIVDAIIDKLFDALIMEATTIATLASQVSFTLTAGSADDDAYEGATIVVVDQSTGVQKAFGSLSAYTGTSKTVTLARDPGVFTMATGDTVYVLPSDVFAIWDRLLSGTTHNVNNSAGKRLRAVADTIILSGTAQAGANTTITLNAGASATDDAFTNMRLITTAGTGAGQVKIIGPYNGTTKVATVLGGAWLVNPDNTTEFEIVPALTHAAGTNQDLAFGYAVSATSTTIVLNGVASAINDFYDDDLIIIHVGTGNGQSRTVKGYVGATKTVTVDQAWITTPDSTSEYVIIGSDRVWDHSTADHAISGSFGKAVADTLADTNELQGDDVPGLIAALNDLSAAEVNAEADTALTDYDGPTNAEMETRTLGAADIAKLSASVGTNVIGAAEAGTLSTTQMTSDLSEATDDHFIGRTVIWTSGVLVNQASDITDYAGATGLLTYTAVTEAPSAADTFVIV